MNILLIAATEAEIALLTEYIAANWKRVSTNSFGQNGKVLDVVITGVGMTATAYALTKALSHKRYDLAIQAGVGGSFDHNIHPGQVVLVTSEQFGDLAAEDREEFIDMFELGLIQKDVFPFTDSKLVTPPSKFHPADLPKVSGLTINTVSGNEHTIRRLKLRYNCQVECMEGAAFHYACLMENTAFMQVRAISNRVEPRDRSKWKMKEAIQNLNDWLVQFLVNIDS